MRRAISPVIATVILIAITIVIGAAVGGWLLGLWGGFGDTEAIRIYPDAKLEIRGSTATLSLTVKNEGTRDARIRKIIVEGVGECPGGQSTISPTPAPILIKTGDFKDITCTMSNVGNKVVAGGSYLVKVMTESGGVYQITVAARGG